MAGVRGRSGGRNAKTRAMHVVEGTFRKDRHGDVVNPDPPIGRPEKPKALNEYASMEWDRMIARLEHSHTLSVVDDAALFQACSLYAETEHIAVQREKTEATIDKLEDALSRLDDGDLVAAVREVTTLKQLEYRYVNQIRQGRMAVRAYLIEFGLTPAARGRVKATDDGSKKPASKLGRFMARG